MSIVSMAEVGGAKAGTWPARRTAVLDWLVKDTHTERFLDLIFRDLCRRIRKAGVPLARATLHVRTNNPQWLGARMLWLPDLDEVEIRTFDYDVVETEGFLRSPINAILSGETEVRLPLEGPPRPGELPIAEELRQQGFTDYVAWPLEFTQDKRHIVSFATDRAGGFDAASLDFLADLVPALALVSEIRIKNRLARTLLETYVGPHASEQILAGATRRGSGATVGAAILICDLREFTAISENWPRDDVIALLNDYFDAMSEPIERHGGEILKFIGDGLLAIFPLTTPTACVDLLRAVTEAQVAMAALNADLQGRGREPLGFGVGVHVGDVMYGNIGSRKRLDFTVIGPAVNVASRLETLTKTVGRQVLLSGTFVGMAGCQALLESLGSFPLRGLGEPIEVFAFAGTRDCTAASDQAA